MARRTASCEATGDECEWVVQVCLARGGRSLSAWHGAHYRAVLSTRTLILTAHFTPLLCSPLAYANSSRALAPGKRRSAPNPHLLRNTVVNYENTKCLDDYVECWVLCWVLMLIILLSVKCWCLWELPADSLLLFAQTYFILTHVCVCVCVCVWVASARAPDAGRCGGHKLKSGIKHSIR